MERRNKPSFDVDDATFLIPGAEEMATRDGEDYTASSSGTIANDISLSVLPPSYAEVLGQGQATAGAYSFSSPNYSSSSTSSYSRWQRQPDENLAHQIESMKINENSYNSYEKLEPERPTYSSASAAEVVPPAAANRPLASVFSRDASQWLPPGPVLDLNDVGPRTTVVVDSGPMSFTGAYVLSCVVYWCFGWLLGGIAFMIATSAESSYNEGDRVKAKQLRITSYVFSFVGIVFGVVVLAVIIMTMR